MNSARHRHTISGAFIFLLLGIFAVASTIMVLLGVRFYRTGTQRSSQHNEYRILSSYVRSMVRAEDETGVLGTDTIDGVDMLTLTEEYDGLRYVTRLYTWDGSLREWFSEEDYAFVPSDGEIIFEADRFHAEIEDHLLTVSMAGSDGEDVAVCMALRAQTGQKEGESQ